MEKQFELLAVTRNNILKEIVSCSLNQLFEIPQGYNNNILWHAVHVMATQQVLVYGCTKTPYRIDQTIVDNYKKGTTPSGQIDAAIVEFAKDNLISTIAQTKKDYQHKIFGSFTAMTTSYGAVLNTVEDAITFLNLHESMHFGQIKMLKKLVGK